jgi:hypothetical protein
MALKRSAENQRVEVGTWEHGTIRSFEMFDKRHVNFAVETALQEALK